MSLVVDYRPDHSGIATETIANADDYEVQDDDFTHFFDQDGNEIKAIATDLIKAITKS